MGKNLWYKIESNYFSIWGRRKLFTHQIYKKDDKIDDILNLI